MTKAEQRALEVYPDYPTMDGGYVTQRRTRKCSSMATRIGKTRKCISTQEDRQSLSLIGSMVKMK